MPEGVVPGGASDVLGTLSDIWLLPSISASSPTPQPRWPSGPAFRELYFSEYVYAGAITFQEHSGAVTGRTGAARPAPTSNCTRTMTIIELITGFGWRALMKIMAPNQDAESFFSDLKSHARVWCSSLRDSAVEVARQVLLH